MFKAQRFMLTLLSIALLILGIALIVQNMAVTVDAQFLAWTFPGVSMGLMLAVAGLLIGGSVFLKMLGLISQAGQQQQKAVREVERREVVREEAEAKVKVLESKIQTLEKALQEALKSSQPR